MPDPAPGTLAGRLRVLAALVTGVSNQLIANVDRNTLLRDVAGLLAELRSLQRAVAEREELAGAIVSHGEQT